MIKQEIQKEIDKLENTKFDWSLTRKDKNEVFILLSSLRNFNHTFTVQYKHAQEFYNRNSFAEIAITDGIGELEDYSNSTLKRKDNRYYDLGIKHIKHGLDIIIKSLKDKMEA